MTAGKLSWIFARRNLRPVSMQWPSIDADLFTQIVGRKRRASAGGLDGVHGS